MPSNGRPNWFARVKSNLTKWMNIYSPICCIQKIFRIRIWWCAPSGERRISNYLLWQVAYAEFYFSEVLWPDFNRAELEKIIADFNTRERRYGKN